VTLAPGIRIGPYEVIAPLGSGGMGEVYRARDTRLDRTVAIKVLPAAIAADPQARARFEREARAVAALDHPHICGLFDVGDADGTLFLVMPLLDGQTLAARIEKGPPLDQALTFATQIADALDKAHRQGIVHRDLKPANIMVTKAGAKLLDFGLAKLKAPAAPISLSGMTQRATSPGTAQGTILGTIQYMAPEQVEGKEADARSDIWALGAVIYEMLTGTRPFQGDTPASVIGAILKDAPPPVSLRQPLSPASLDHVVACCLEKDPDDRWQSAGDVKRELQWIGKGQGANAQLSGAPARSRIMSTAAPLVAAALAGGIGFWVGQPRGASGVETPGRPVVFTVEPPPGTRLSGPPASTPVPQLAISPDGRSLAFVVATGQGRSGLWVRALDEPQARPIAGTEGAVDPFWAPDGRRLGFMVDGAIKVTGIGTDASAQVVGQGPVDSRGGAWLLDGSILFYTARPDVLGRVSDTGGPVSEIPLGEAIGMARWPELLPGGGYLLYQVRNADPTLRGTYVRSSTKNGSEPRRLIGSDWSVHYGSGHLLYLEGSTLMAQPFDVASLALTGTPSALARGVGGSSTGFGAFSVSATGVLAYAGALPNQCELRWVDRMGRVGDVVVAKGDFVDLSLSPDQSRLAYARVDPQTQAPDVWILDMSRGTTARITSERLVDASPVWSPGGDQLVFRSNRASTIGVELYLTSASPGGAVKKFFALDDAGSRTISNAIPTYWPPSGDVLFYVATADAGYGIWTKAVEQGSPRVILDTKDNELHPAVSPDGRWMAYASDQSGRYEIYVQDFPGGAQQTVVSTNGGMQPQWRGDGRELYYIQADGSLMQVTVRAGERFDSATPTALFKTDIPTVLNPYRMDYVPARDGQRFLMKVPVNEAPSAITVVLNWPALLQN
jgi:eukaryotic-like serine/threonine-protein kinase